MLHTASPAILGLPTSTALYIIELNCAVFITEAQQPLLGQHTNSEMSKPMMDCLHTMNTDTHDKQ